MITRIWQAIGWLGVAAALVLSLGHPVLDESGHRDKVMHLAGYAVLMFWWAQLVTRQRWKLAIAVVLFGGGIELLQGLTPDRDPDVFDALTNTGGVLIGWLTARLMPNLPGVLARLPAFRR